MRLTEEGFYEAANFTIYVIGCGKLRQVREFEFRILIDTYPNVTSISRS